MNLPSALLLLASCAPGAPTHPLDQTWVDETEPPTAEFALVDAAGAPFDGRRLVGRWTLVALGYTSCPDVCPTTLASLARALPRLDPALRAQGVFLAVDPDRDADRLAAYVAWFDPALVGVTGSRDAIDQAVDALGGAYALGDDGQVDHSTSVFVVDPVGRVVGYALRPSDTDVLVRDVTAAAAAWTAPLSADLWVRPAPAGAPMAAYGTLRADGPDGIGLVGVSSPDFGAAHVHETVVDRGVARMAATALSIPAHGAVALEPGGRHLMLMAPREPLGATVLLRLDTTAGGVLALAPVEAR